MTGWKKRPRVLDDEDKRRFLDQFNTRYPTPHRDLCIVRVMLEAGLRLEEALSLKPDHVDLRSGKVTVRGGKNDKDRTTYVSDRTIECLASWMERKPDSEWLFPTRSGNKIIPRNFRRRVKRAAKNAGLSEWERVSPHTLRHTAATDLLQQTGNVETVRRILGHAQLNTTQKYLHLVDEDEFRDAVRAALNARKALND